MIILRHETLHQSDRLEYVPKLVIIHGDAGRSDDGTVEWIKSEKSKVSYHYLVGRTGKVHQFVDESKKAWHAGISHWPGFTVQKSVNAQSIGVAFANDGAEAYRPAQYEAGAQLVAEICKRHGIALGRVLGHADVSPARKTDPWKHFDWTTFRALLTKRGVAA